jgi:hypothetical protein
MTCPTLGTFGAHWVDGGYPILDMPLASGRNQRRRYRAAEVPTLAQIDQNTITAGSQVLQAQGIGRLRFFQPAKLQGTRGRCLTSIDFRKGYCGRSSDGASTAGYIRRRDCYACSLAVGEWPARAPAPSGRQALTRGRWALLRSRCRP